MQITPRVHKIGSFVNQYLLIDGNDLILIDTGMKSNAKNIFRYIERIGHKPQELKQILITHSDSDHYGAVFEIKKITGADILTSRIEAEAMQKGESSRPIVPEGFFKIIFPLLRGFLESPPVTVDRIIEGGDTLPVLGGLQVIAAPGHTPGQIAFFLPHEKILFAGDSITIENKKPVATTDATTGDPEAARKTFQKLMQLNPSIICAGHAFFHIRNE